MKTHAQIRVYLFRHGQTDWNAQGRIQGHLDIPLNENGRTQARRLAPHLKRLGVQLILSSDLDRAKESAALAKGELSIPLADDSRLREVFLGKAQGMTRMEVEATYGTDLSARIGKHPLNDSDVAMLGGESTDEVWKRATEAVIEICGKNPHVHTLAVSSHGGVIRRLIERAHRIDNGRLMGLDAIGWIGNGALYPMLLSPSLRRWEIDHSLTLP